MDLQNILTVPNDRELDEDKGPSENSGANINKTTVVETRTLNDKTSHQSQETHIAKRNSIERVYVDCRASIDEKNCICNDISIFAKLGISTSEGTHPAEQPIKTGIQTINEDSIREISQYLNVFELINLGQTCNGLQILVENILLTRQTKVIDVQTMNDLDLYDDYEQWDYINDVLFPADIVIIKLDHTYSSNTLKGLVDGIKYFGRSVEAFNFTYFFYFDHQTGGDNAWHSIVNVISHCTNLKTLKIEGVAFTSERANELKELIDSLKNLKVLKIIDCSKLTSNWPATLKPNSTIEKLTLKMGECNKEEISDDFLEYFKNVSSLSFQSNGEECVTLLGHYGHSLKLLKLCIAKYESLTPVITENLTELEHLKITLADRDEFIDLPHLKTVHLSDHEYLGSILRKLSDKGIIECLVFHGYCILSENMTFPPFIFNKLQTITFDEYTKSNVFRTMAKAQMPVLRNILITLSNQQYLHDLWQIVEANSTITLIRLEFREHTVIPLSTWIELIDILRKPCSPNRNVLYLRISAWPIEQEAVRLNYLKKILNFFIKTTFFLQFQWELLKGNRHLIKVEQTRRHYQRSIPSDRNEIMEQFCC